jgi:hypothetical protein
VAFETPKIWAKFLHIPRRLVPIFCGGFEAICTLDRKSRIVSSIRLAVQKCGTSRSHFTIDDLANIDSGQWQDVHLSVPHSDLTSEQFESNLHRRLPALETLQINTSGASGGNTVVAFEHAPKLRVVILQCLRPTQILLPWRQLTHFRGAELGRL